MNSDLKKEIMNEVKAIFSEKNNEIEVLKSQLLYCRMMGVQWSKPSIKKLMNYGTSMEEGFASAWKVLNIKLTKIWGSFGKSDQDYKGVWRWNSWISSW